MFHRIGYLCIFAVGLAILGVFIAGFIYLITYVPPGLKSRTWPSVAGKVQRSEVVSYSRGSIIQVEYEFEVDGVRYASNRFQFSPKNGPPADDVSREVYVPGKTLTVFYDPHDPNRSVLEPGVSAGDWFCIGVFGAVLVWFLWILLACLRDARRKSGEPAPSAMN